MLIDDHLPGFDFVERHRVRVRAPPSAAFAAVRRGDLGRGPLTRTLMLLRALPGLVVAPRESARRFLRGGRREPRRVDPADGGAATVSTETRVLCTDPGSRRAFRRYWRIVRPFSGLIRIEMLRSIRREAERTASREPS
jgi:hypothetical protein